MAILRSPFLRRSTLSLFLPHHHRSLPSTPGIYPSSPPWKLDSIRLKSSSSKPKRRNSDGLYDDFSLSQIDIFEDYKFAYEAFKPRELDITEIEGCDLKHWLITIDFPKDPKPCPEDMIRFYEKTVAKALNLSLEEAKKKIYACSTSNYTGFHVEVSEEESEKFRGKSGVVFILPDSYVDNEKKEYGGDKYIDGIIIPRPRPTISGKTRKEPKKDKPDEPLPDWLGSSSRTQELSMQESIPRPSQIQPTIRNILSQSWDNKQGPKLKKQPERSFKASPSHPSRPQPQNDNDFVTHLGNYQQKPPPNYLGPGNSENYWQEQNIGTVGTGYQALSGFLQVNPRYDAPQFRYCTSYKTGPAVYQPHWQGSTTVQGYMYPEWPVQGQGFAATLSHNDYYPNPYEQRPNNGYQEGQGLPMGYWRGPIF